MNGYSAEVAAYSDKKLEDSLRIVTQDWTRYANPSTDIHWWAMAVHKEAKRRKAKTK